MSDAKDMQSFDELFDRYLAIDEAARETVAASQATLARLSITSSRSLLPLRKRRRL